MNPRIWTNLQQRNSKGKSGWQLVGRGEPSSAPKKDDGRTVRPLTYSEITKKMSSEDAAWHIHFNKTNWEAAFAEQEKRYASKKFVAKSKVELMWQGHATREEDEGAIHAAQNFTKKFPQFERSNENVQKMIIHMRERNYDGTDEASYVRAYRELVEQGKIKPLSYQSANDFYDQHKELHPTQKPPLVQAKEEKAEATKSAFQRAEAATAQAGSTRVTAYPVEQRGVPPLSDIEKASLRQKVRSMSADELAEKCSTDPSFRKALDSLR